MDLGSLNLDCMAAVRDTLACVVGGIVLRRARNKVLAADFKVPLPNLLAASPLGSAVKTLFRVRL